jgi:hypothetical protein
VAQYGRTEIAQFVCAVFDEKIDRFEVSMDYGGTLRVKIGDGVADLTERNDQRGEIESCVFGGRGTHPFDGIEGRASLAVFHEDQMLERSIAVGSWIVLLDVAACISVSVVSILGPGGISKAIVVHLDDTGMAQSL